MEDSERQWRIMNDIEGQWRTVKDSAELCRTVQWNKLDLIIAKGFVHHLDVYVLLIRGGSEILMDLSQDGNTRKFLLYSALHALILSSYYTTAFLLYVSLNDKKISDCMRKDCIQFLHQGHLQFFLHFQLNNRQKSLIKLIFTKIKMFEQ
jgi:hypothetical protein